MGTPTEEKSPVYKTYKNGTFLYNMSFVVGINNSCHPHLTYIIGNLRFVGSIIRVCVSYHDCICTTLVIILY